MLNSQIKPAIKQKINYVNVCVKRIARNYRDGNLTTVFGNENHIKLKLMFNYFAFLFIYATNCICQKRLLRVNVFKTVPILVNVLFALFLKPSQYACSNKLMKVENIFFQLQHFSIQVKEYASKLKITILSSKKERMIYPVVYDMKRNVILGTHQRQNKVKGNETFLSSRFLHSLKRFRHMHGI